ncbi:MAG: LemA family protein [Candidatus Thorarchaeota archaeon]
MEMKAVIGCVLVGVLAIGVISGVMIIGNYNELVTLEYEAETEWSNIWVQVERKMDLIPQVQTIVESYGAYEQETLLLLVGLRTQWMSSNDSLAQRDNLSDTVTETLNQIIIAFEAYPDLKADTLYLDWLVEVAGTENRITNAKLDYNEAVQNYNIKLRAFPGNWVGGMFGFTPMELYTDRIA